MSGLSVAVVGAGPLGLQAAIQASERGHEVTLISSVIPDTLENAKIITGGNAAGYGGPFGGKDPMILRFVEESWQSWMELARNNEYSPVQEIKARIVTQDPKFLQYISNFPGFKNPTELGIPNVIEIDAYAFNPRAILIEWSLRIKELGVKIVNRTLSADEVQQLREGKSLFGSDLTLECAGLNARDIHPEFGLQPIRGILGHFKADFRNIPIPVSVMDEEGSDLLYLIPRPGIEPGTWQLILGGSFDVGVGTCSDPEKQSLMWEKFALVRQKFPGIAPDTTELLLPSQWTETSVDYRPTTLDGAPIIRRIDNGSSSNHVLVVNGARGQGFVPVFELINHALDVGEGFMRGVPN